MTIKQKYRNVQKAGSPDYGTVPRAGSPINKKFTGARSPRYKIVPRDPSLRSKNVPMAASPGYMYVPATGYIYVMRAASLYRSVLRAVSPCY